MIYTYIHTYIPDFFNRFNNNFQGGLGEKWKEDPNYKDRLYDAVLDGDTKAKCRIPKTDAKFASFKLVLKNDKGQEGNFGQIFIYDSECVACTNGKCSHVVIITCNITL